MALVPLIIVNKEVTHNFEVRAGLGFQGICEKYSTPIEFDCRKADCGICIIKILKGEENLSPQTASEAEFLKAMNADDNERLACQVRVMGPVTIEVDTF